MLLRRFFLLYKLLITSTKNFLVKNSQKTLVSLKKGCTFAAVFDLTEEGQTSGEVGEFFESLRPA